MPKAFGAWLEVGDQRFSSSESNASMKTIRCGSLSDRAPARVRNETDGAPPAENLREKTPIPDFKEQPERATAPYNLGARVVTAGSLWNGAIASYEQSR